MPAMPVQTLSCSTWRGHYKTVFALQYSKLGLLHLITGYISNSSQSLVDACWPDAWLSTSVHVHTCERLIKTSLDLALTPSVGAFIVWQSANNPLMLRERKTKKANRVKNFHKWTPYSKAYRASWHYDCSYASSSSTLELIPSFSLLCSQMSSCRQHWG